MTDLWGLHWSTGSDKPGTGFFATCPDEGTATSRARWWARYRSDVRVRVCVAETEGTWRFADDGQPVGIRRVARSVRKAYLSEAEVVEVKARLVANERREDIAAAFGVAAATIGHIATGRTWANVGCVG